jgi:hypothetical protein
VCQSYHSAALLWWWNDVATTRDTKTGAVQSSVNGGAAFETRFALLSGRSCCVRGLARCSSRESRDTGRHRPRGVDDAAPGQGAARRGHLSASCTKKRLSERPHTARAHTMRGARTSLTGCRTIACRCTLRLLERQQKRAPLFVPPSLLALGRPPAARKGRRHGGRCGMRVCVQRVHACTSEREKRAAASRAGALAV